VTAVRTALLALVLTGSLLAAGCDGNSGAGENAIHGPAAEKLPVSGALLLVSGPFNGTGAERITGTPEFVNGCLGAKNDQQTFVVVWPDGTAVTSPKDDTIKVDGKSIPVGSTFVAKGSFVHTPFPDQLPDIPLACQGGGLNGVAWIQEVTSVTG
jgi:hypothetical protein